MKHSQIRWQDGSYDSDRICDECGKPDCEYPVHRDRYHEIVTKQSYWDWINKNEVKIDDNS